MPRVPGNISFLAIEIQGLEFLCLDKTCQQKKREQKNCQGERGVAAPLEQIPGDFLFPIASAHLRFRWAGTRRFQAMWHNSTHGIPVCPHPVKRGPPRSATGEAADLDGAI